MLTLTADEHLLLQTLNRGPTGYTDIVKMFAGSRDRAIAAIDRLLEAGEISRRCIFHTTMFVIAADATPVRR